MSFSKSVIKEGWLYKWVNILRGYKKRWFVLDLSHLSYYREQHNLDSLHGGILVLNLLIHHGSGITFVVSDGRAHAFHLKASSEIEKDQWITALQLAKGQAVRLAESEEFSIALNQDIDGINHLTNILNSNFQDLCTCHVRLKTSGKSLQTALSELHTIENDASLQSKLCCILKNASSVKMNLDKTLHDCEELLQTAEDHKSNLENMKQLIIHRLKYLDKTVVQLALENSCLTSTLKGTKLGGIPLGYYEDEQFYDALEISPSECFQSSQKSNFRTPLCTDCSSPSKCNFGSPYLDGDTCEIASSILQILSPQPSLSKELDIRSTDHQAPLHRTTLPVHPHCTVNVWTVIKNCIGKDLTHISMPVYFNEPLSMLQRLTEDYEYAGLLHKAASCRDSCEQLLYVSAFAVSSYSSSLDRNGKPFNPLLGETYECDRFEELGWRCISEQVSHHPPILAQHCEATGWVLWQEFSVDVGISGTYISVTPSGICHLEFSSSGNHYTWGKVYSTVHNVVVGNLWIDHHGEMNIVNHLTDDKCIVQFSQYKLFQSSSYRKVSGIIKDRRGNAQWVLRGTWDEKIDALKVSGVGDEETPSVIWRKTISEGKRPYNMSVFACQLNEPEKGVAPTDSRFRPDQRLMEEGKWNEANLIKIQLEEKQRQRRLLRDQEAEKAAERGEEYPDYSPAWFKMKLDPITKNPIHRFTGEYWNCKDIQDWTRCPELYL